MLKSSSVIRLAILATLGWVAAFTPLSVQAENSGGAGAEKAQEMREAHRAEREAFRDQVRTQAREMKDKQIEERRAMGEEVRNEAMQQRDAQRQENRDARRAAAQERREKAKERAEQARERGRQMKANRSKGVSE